MNFHTFFSGIQRFKTLNTFLNIIKLHNASPIQFAEFILTTHLSTLQISPHGTFLADGNTSAIKNTQHKYWECDHHHEYNAQHYCCHRQAATQYVYTITRWLATAGDTSHHQGETLTQQPTWTNPHNHSDLDPNIWDEKYTELTDSKNSIIRIIYTTIQKFGVSKIFLFYVFERSLF